MLRCAAPRSAAQLAPLLLWALACGPHLTPEEEVELIRSQYTAELKSLTVKQDPVSDGAVASADTAVASGTESAGPADAAAPEVRTDVTLDIVVSTTSQQYLPGVTLDIEHVDADRRTKGVRTLWVATSALARGDTAEVTHVLENVDWEAGDGFQVEVRTPIPADERATYREFRFE